MSTSFGASEREKVNEWVRQKGKATEPITKGWAEGREERNLFEFTTLDSIFMALSASRTMVSNFIRSIESLGGFFMIVFLLLLLLLSSRPNQIGHEGRCELPAQQPWPIKWMLAWRRTERADKKAFSSVAQALLSKPDVPFKAPTHQGEKRPGTSNLCFYSPSASAYPKIFMDF